MDINIMQLRGTCCNLTMFGRYVSSQGRKFDPPQAMSALEHARPPDLPTLRAEPALEADVLGAIADLTAAAEDAATTQLPQVHWSDLLNNLGEGWAENTGAWREIQKGKSDINREENRIIDHR